MMLNDAQAVAPVQLHGTLSPLVMKSHLLGKADPQQRIALSLGLQPRNLAALQRYVQDIVRPGSPDYHHFLSPEQFIATFSPDEDSYNSLRTYAQEEGFTITHAYSHRLLLSVSGTLAQAQQAFHVTFHTYRGSDGTLYYANDQEPSMPAMLARTVQSVVGLNDALLWHPALALPQPARKNPGVASAGNSCPVPGKGYVTPDQFSSWYHLQPLVAQHLQGEGQTMALFELSTFSKADLSAYAACFGHAHTTIQAIPTGTGPIPSGSGMLETQMDAEMVLSDLPQLNTLKIYEAANDDSDVLAEWAQIVQDAVPVVSMSWGICELEANQSMIQQEHVLFTAAAAQGQSIFAASGDSGSSGCGDGRLSADDPSSQPFVTGVGGTTMTPSGSTTGSANSMSSTYGTEQAWKTPLSASQGTGAGGGGISRYWSAPDWQAAPGVRNNYTTGSICHATAGSFCRETPDVALHADPRRGYLVYCTVAVAGCTTQNPWVVAGGTSAAAPLWAALAVQANELSLRQGGTRLGPLNELLYQIARSPASYANDFHDVTTGNTDLGNANQGAYPTTSGYDMATGLGSYNGCNLVNDLVALNMRQQSQPDSSASTSWYFAEGSVGGSFQQYITLHNPHPLQDSTVILHYLFQDRAPIAVEHVVKRDARLTVNVNRDLQIKATDRQVAVSTIVEVAKGSPGVVAERPMYFTYRGIQSGTDVIGATAPASSYYFPMVDTRQQGRSYYTYLTLLNPDAHKTATATLTYYTGTCGPTWQTACPTQQIEIAPQRRGTITPGMFPSNRQGAASVHSDVPIVVERALYIKDTIPQAGGVTTGATSEIGATSPATQWSFAEGNTAPFFQEDLMLANFGAVDTPAHIRLEYNNGHSQTASVNVPGQSQLLFDVNQANSQPTGTCDTNPCQTTPTASIKVTADEPVVVERLMYFHWNKRISGVSTTPGEPGPITARTYAFAEGFTANGFEEFLTLYNPTDQDENVTITLFANTYTLHHQVFVQAHTRQTLDINALVAPVVQRHLNLGSDSYSVAMTVQPPDGGQILPERSLYFNYHSMQGGTMLIGYAQ
jgi:kumamolisin